ncbi:MAG TPA: PKD domain-containing protein, partial [Puia sp.]|nr:PKD domain-containing protein [Puia sp.]
GVSADLRSYIDGRYDSSGCVPLNVQLTDTIHNAKMYIWNFGDGTPDTLTTSNQVNHLYGNIGTYPVRLIAIDSTTCNIADTVYLNIRARNDKADIAFNATKLPPCQSLSYRFDNVSVAPAGKPFGPNSFTWNFGDGTPPVTASTPSITHAFASPGTYNVSLVMVDTNYCNYPDSAQRTLRIAPIVKAQFDVPSGCAPYNAQFNNTSVAGQQFLWDFGDGSTSTDFSPVHLYADTGAFTIRLTVIDSATCNIIDSTSRSILVHSKPQAAFSDQPVPPQVNTPTVFTNNSSPSATQFKWFFGDGDTLFRTTRNIPDTVIHQYNSTGTFQACLVAYNQFGCTDTACAPVQALINPLLDVPNAFTPGRFGQNSIVRVRGFGIANMTFRIYNRWGQKVFESNNPNYGWDGNFNGKPQPMDVYAYTLDATFFDGKKTTRTGDITLIR